MDCKCTLLSMLMFGLTTGQLVLIEWWDCKGQSIHIWSVSKRLGGRGGGGRMVTSVSKPGGMERSQVGLTARNSKQIVLQANISFTDCLIHQVCLQFLWKTACNGISWISAVFCFWFMCVCRRVCVWWYGEQIYCNWVHVMVLIGFRKNNM